MAASKNVSTANAALMILALELNMGCRWQQTYWHELIHAYGVLLKDKQ
jgi:hypothetical protein